MKEYQSRKNNSTRDRARGRFGPSREDARWPCSRQGTVADIVARIERMPISAWHLRARFIIGVATFFDGFDAIAIAYVLPVIGPQWHLTPGQIGLLLSASFGGQLIAALFFGWWAERYGRMPAII